MFVDTAGIRRKGKTTQMAEKLSVVMARRHLRLADAALLLVEPREGVTALDANIAGYAHEAGKACVIVVNKWDLSETAQAEFAGMSASSSNFSTTPRSRSSRRSRATASKTCFRSC